MTTHGRASALQNTRTARQCLATSPKWSEDELTIRVKQNSSSKFCGGDVSRQPETSTTAHGFVLFTASNCLLCHKCIASLFVHNLQATLVTFEVHTFLMRGVLARDAVLLLTTKRPPEYVLALAMEQRELW